MSAKKLFSCLLFLSTMSLSQSIIWNNGIGKKEITATKICYIKIINNKVETWYNEGDLYWKTVIINSKEYVCSLPSDYAKAQFNALENRFKVHYISRENLKKYFNGTP